MTSMRRASILLGVAVATDGYDIQLVSIGGKAMLGAVGATLDHLGGIFAAGMIGATLGPLLFGPLGDIYGRKPLVLLALALLGATTLLMPFAPTVGWMEVVRFSSGLALGALVPACITLAGEYSPAQERGTAIGMLISASMIGGVIGGLVNGTIVAQFGWRMLFLVGAVLPLLISVSMWKLLPESEQFGDLVTLRQLRAEEETGAPSPESKSRSTGKHWRQGRSTFLSVLRAVQLTKTATIWVALALSSGMITFMFLWMPPLLQSTGLSVVTTGILLASANGGGIAGSLIAGRIAKRFGATAPIVGSLLLSALLLAGMSVLTTSPGLAVGAALTVALAMIASATLFAANNELFRVENRSTGNALAGISSRLGQAASPLLVGALVAANIDVSRIFLAMAGLPLVAALVVAAGSHCHMRLRSVRDDPSA